jgi:hypothetical protein
MELNHKEIRASVHPLELKGNKEYGFREWDWIMI